MVLKHSSFTPSPFHSATSYFFPPPSLLEHSLSSSLTLFCSLHLSPHLFCILAKLTEFEKCRATCIQTGVFSGRIHAEMWQNEHECRLLMTALLSDWLRRRLKGVISNRHNQGVQNALISFLIRYCVSTAGMPTQGLQQENAGSSCNQTKSPFLHRDPKQTSVAWCCVLEAEEAWCVTQQPLCLLTVLI